MQNVYSVKQVNAYIKNMFTQDYLLNRIYVRGEVSNCKYHTSGHIYFSLKDESGTIACIMFAGSRSGLSFRMAEGQQVIALGNISAYERDGKYQLYAREIIQDGAGLLYERFEALKKQLEEMGLFAQEYKRSIPMYPKTVGIVTAPTGAAIQDIIHIATRRNPYVQLMLYPAQVQGDGAAQSIIQGIKALENRHVDVMIIGRGGGSIEDLWAFNEESVARAIFECSVPIISAVGHETDTTISDYAADLRAPTPSAAAELAIYEYAGVEAVFGEYHMQLHRSMLRKVELLRSQTEHTALKLKYAHPQQKLMEKRQRAADLETELRRGMQDKLLKRKHRLAVFLERMKGLSPLSKLNQGFSYVEDAMGTVIKSVQDVKNKEEITVYVTDGYIRAKVSETVKEEYHGSGK